MRKRLKFKIIERFLDDDQREKYDHMQERRSQNNKKLKASMISHLSALNDGVIAIFITVMMLEIPYPKLKSEYGSFIWSVMVFLVSFFIIADFWYENKRIFQTMREADHVVVVANFMFLASLALIPATTKWIMNQTDKYSELSFGTTYLIAMLMQEFLYYATVRKRFRNYLPLFFLIILTQIGGLIIINTGLMVLAWFHPRVAMMLYISMPIISFFLPEWYKEMEDEESGKT